MEALWNGAVIARSDAIETVEGNAYFPAAIRDYFVEFLARSPRGRIDSRSILLGCNSAVDAGTYSFLVRDPSAPAQAPHWVSARYTFVYSLADGRWLIQHHHSSLQPPSS